jgi:ABC-2 type transport system permease protein
MLVFGYAATFEIHHVSTVVLDLDHSQESRELISRFTSSPYFDVQRQLTDSRQIAISSIRDKPPSAWRSMPALRRSCARARPRRCR